MKTCLTVRQWFWWKASVWPGGRTEPWKIFFISKRIGKFERKRLLQWGQLEPRGARDMGLSCGPSTGSQSWLLGHSLGPLGWTPDVLSKLSGKPSGGVRRRQRTWYVILVHATEVCLLQGVVLYVKLYCHKALVFSSGPNAYCEPTGNCCILTCCIFLCHQFLVIVLLKYLFCSWLSIICSW